MLDIFRYFVYTTEEEEAERLKYLIWFAECFPIEEFHDDEKILVDYINYSSKLEVLLKPDYFLIYAETDLRKFLLKTKTKIAGTQDLNYEDSSAFETAYRIIRDHIIDTIKQWQSEPVITTDFIVSAKSFLHRQLDTCLVDALSATFDMRQDTENAADALSFAQLRLEQIRETYDENKLEELIMRKAGANTDVLDFVCDTGLPVVDTDMEGLYTTHLCGVEAAPGTGKTRFALSIWAYRAAVSYKKDVLFFTLEQDKSECEAILVSHHTFQLFGIYVSDSQIVKGNVPEDCKSQVQTARLDLFESGKYGKIEIVADSLYIETFIGKIRSTDRNKGPFDIIIIDYMGLIGEHKPYGRGKTIGELVAYSYKEFKKYLRFNKKAGIAVNQLNKEGVEASKADKEIIAGMGMGGMEVHRSTDVNITLSMTTEMKQQSKIRLSSTKARSSAGGYSTVIDTRLAVSYFFQTANKII